MSDMAIATAGLAMQHSSQGQDATMMMLKQIVQQEQAVLQLVQAAMPPAQGSSSQPHLGTKLDIVA